MRFTFPPYGLIAFVVAGFVPLKNPDLRHFGFTGAEPPASDPIPPTITPFSG